MTTLVIIVLVTSVCVALCPWRAQNTASRRAQSLVGDAESLPSSSMAGHAGPGWTAWAFITLPGFLKRTRAEGCCVTGGVLAAFLLHSWVPAVAAGGVVPLVRRWHSKVTSRKAADRRRAAVIELCGMVSAELRTGRAPHVVLAEAIGESSLFLEDGLRSAVVRVLAAARFGGDVPAELRNAAVIPGAEGLAGLAACWQVSVDRGAGLAGGVDRVASALRAEQQQREELQAQLAGPRSTAWLLAILPVIGVLLGTAMGARPLSILLHTPVGVGCLVIGAAMEWAGIAWTAHIVRDAV